MNEALRLQGLLGNCFPQSVIFSSLVLCVGYERELFLYIFFLLCNKNNSTAHVVVVFAHYSFLVCSISVKIKLFDYLISCLVQALIYVVFARPVHALERFARCKYFARLYLLPINIPSTHLTYCTRLSSFCLETHALFKR